MKITTIRRISQGFFVVLFMWFCLVSQIGDQWWQIRGWSVNWLIEIDPLVGLGTLLTTHTVYSGLLWGLATVVLTILLGRFFCSWVCPFGAIHHFVGFLAHWKKSPLHRAKINRYRKTQSLKYWILAFLLIAAMANLIVTLLNFPGEEFWEYCVLVAICLAGLASLAFFGFIRSFKRAAALVLALFAAWVALSLIFPGDRMDTASLQFGLLDPIPLLHRSLNLAIIPILDASVPRFSASPRYYEGALLIGLIFLTSLFLNLVIPRFYCRFVCPLGALLGVLSRFAPWRIFKTEQKCRECMLCDANCEGACEPSRQIRIAECVLCMNCLYTCRDGIMDYGTSPSANGEILNPDLTKRELLTAVLSGAAVVPMLRLAGYTGSNWHPEVIRPPGALPEKLFLTRCIKCGQCMRICPTNIIHPATLQAGLEGLWTPVLNFRIGTSGCQLNCVACANLCPTSAIRPIELEEKLGLRRYAKRGPIKLGTAFVDQGRCLPWAMDRPCIVCQENCPVSPKAIFTRESFMTIRNGAQLVVKKSDTRVVELVGTELDPARYASGDYYCSAREQNDAPPRLISENTKHTLTVSPEQSFASPLPAGSVIDIQVRLLRPFVDPEKCIGCGVCEHECPVRGKRAIRVTAENESRSREHSLLIPLFRAGTVDKSQ